MNTEKNVFHDSCVPEKMRLSDERFNEDCRKISFDYVEAIIGTEKPVGILHGDDKKIFESEFVEMQYKIYACYKFRPHWENLWPFGGRVIPSETVVQAIRRQIKSKVGITIQAKRIDLLPFPLAFRSVDKNSKTLIQTRSTIAWINASEKLIEKLQELPRLPKEKSYKGICMLDIDYCTDSDALLANDQKNIDPAMSEILVHVHNYLHFKQTIQDFPVATKLFKEMQDRAKRLIVVNHDC